MSKAEVIALIKRNGNTRREAIILIADFLVTNKKEANRIYEQEFLCT